MDNQEVIKTLTVDACIALFNDYSLPLQLAEPTAEPLEVELLYCSVIGFSSAQMRGSLLLATTREPLGLTSPVKGNPLYEWIAELSNQLLGRIKRQLTDRGVELAISTPIVLRGERLHPMPSGDAAPLTFVCEGGSIRVWMDAVLVPGLDLSQVQASEPGMGEGDALLF